MIMEELQERRRRRAIRVAITETFMAISVVFLVAILTLIVMGYGFGKDLEVERSGMLQLNSSPSGATVTIDDDTLLARTNLSRTLSSGEHTISITKDGYDTWSKKIVITEGIYYRLTYPRLFLKERTPTAVLHFDEETTGTLTAASVAPDRTTMLASAGGTWGIINLSSAEPEFKALDLSILPASVCMNDVQIQKWSNNSEKLLTTMVCDGTTEWVLFNVKDPAESVNLTRTFALNFSQIELENDSADRILVLVDNNLREINVSSLEISKVLLEGVASFTSNSSTVAYVTVVDESGEKSIGIYKDGEKGGTIISTAASDTVVSAVVNEYYGDEYLIVTIDNQMQIYSGSLPSYQQKDTTKKLTLTGEETLDFVPATLTIRGDGELVVAQNGANVAVLDTESLLISNYITSGQVYWLDSFMFSTIQDGNLVAYDFDKTNERPLAGAVSEQYPAVITSNGKWLYYFSDNTLVREKIN